jgi:hypothetical protein
MPLAERECVCVHLNLKGFSFSLRCRGGTLILPVNCTESTYSQAGDDIPSDPSGITDTLETMKSVFKKISTKQK